MDSWHHHDRSLCADKQSVPHLLRKGATLGTCECRPYNSDKKDLITGNDDQDITVYPNPNKGVFTIQWLNSPTIMIQVIDQVGQVAFSQAIHTEGEIQQLPIEMPTTAKGLYLVQIKGRAGTRTKKIIIEK